MNFKNFLVFKAAHDFIGAILIDEYEKKKSKNTSSKIKCLNQMWAYTLMLKTYTNIIEQEKIELQSKHNKEIQKLKKQLDEANNIIRFKNLGSSRFTNQNEKR